MRKIFINVILLIILYIILDIIVVNFDEVGFCIAAISYLIFTYLRLKSELNKKKVVISLFLILFLINLFVLTLVFIIEGSEGIRLGGLLFIPFYAISILSGYFLSTISTLKFKIALSLSFLLIISLASLVIISFSEQIDFYGNIDGSVNYTSNDSSFNVLDFKNSKRLNLLEIEKEIIVLDFWNNNCAVCYIKFPKYKKLRDKYKNNNEIGFYTINSYDEEEEIAEGQLISDSLNYKFLNYFQDRKISEKLNVYAFPTVLVLKNDKVVYRGSIEVLSTLDFIYLHR